MPRIPFSVDSALLEELGERLVGKPHIALAELVKNGYDADAPTVTIEFEPKDDCIIVSDTGNGMTLEEFKKFWMRIGSIYKREQKTSRNLNRIMTGSKGVGRLSVQFLAREMRLFTTSEYDLNSQIEASIKWEEAVKAGDLIDAEVYYEINKKETEHPQGTRIILLGLKHEWNVDEVEGLAREIWQLAPPFKMKYYKRETKQFSVEFKSSEGEFKKIFEEQLNAILKIWYARIVGENNGGKVNFSVEFAGEEPKKQNFVIPDCVLENGDFEIRIYHLIRRQPYGIKVGQARKYLNDYGGVYVYDGGFQLPFYGDQSNDWLNLERSHSHRLSKSKLLPKELQDIDEYLNFLPTTSRTLGVVNVSTNLEPHLDIVITRDRLQISQAFDNLSYMIRWTLHYYAYEEKIRALKLIELKTDIEKPKYKKISDVVEYYKPKIDEEVYKELNKDIKQVAKEIETEAEEIAKRVSIVGSLSTIGVTSLAYQHENKRHFRNIENLLKDLKEIINKIEDQQIKSSLLKLEKGLNIWLEDMRTTNNLFSYIGDSENLTEKKRFPVRAMIEDVINQVESLKGDVKIDIRRV